MQGYQITFFTQQDRTHGSMPIAQWLVEQAKRQGIRGATLNGAIEGLGYDGRIHTINMFDLSDQPLQVTFVVSDEEARLLFAHLLQEKVQVFYMILPVEFGMLGSENSNMPQMLSS